MQNNANFKLSPRMLTLLTLGAVFEMGLILFPTLLFPVGGRSTIISLILANIPTLLAVIIIARSRQQCPDLEFQDFLVYLFGKPVGIFLTIAYLLFWIYIAMRITVQFGNLTHIFLLFRTPLPVITGLLLLPVFLNVSRGLETLAVFAEAVFPILAGFLFFILVFSLPTLDITKLFPLFEEDWGKIIKTTGIYAVNLEGIEILLYFIPLAAEPRKAVSAGLKGVFFVNVIALISITEILLAFGTVEPSWQLYPLMSWIRSVSIRSELFQRMDVLFLSVWITAVILAIAIRVEIASSITTRLLPRFTKKVWLFILLGIILLPSFLSFDVITFREVTQKIQSFLVIYVYLLPLIIYLAAILKSKKNEGKQQ